MLYCIYLVDEMLYIEMVKYFILYFIYFIDETRYIPLPRHYSILYIWLIRHSIVYSIFH